jgi:C4-dicarboxylate transporter DctM subunit
MFLLLVNVALLLLGIFIEPLPALLLTAPLFLPPRSSKSISCTSAS